MKTKETIIIRRFWCQYISRLIFLSVFFAATLTACDPDDLDDGDTTDIPAETLAVNEWIDGVMKEVYLWNTRIPSSVNYKKEPDPKELFNKLLYTEEDQWSWITDDWASYLKELEGTPVSMGYSPAFFYKNSTSNEVIIVVKYVYKGSPAELAGLKRGDIILTINGQMLNDQNFYDLYSAHSYTAGLGTYSIDTETFKLTGTQISMTAISFKADPVLHYETKQIEGHKIGYMVYTDFTSGVNNSFHKSIDAAISFFKTSDLSDLIIDLRYNPGGEPSTATYLASSVVPRFVAEDQKIFLRMVYNKKLQDYFDLKNEDKYKYYQFSVSADNLNLNKIYFLTTNSTASASEALIIGLKPYMNVVMVGDTTRGKYTGAWVLPDQNEPPKHNWCMIPIVLKYSNASGFTDFKNGIAPDVYSKDYLIPAYPFGNLNDRVLATAIEQITGTPVVPTKSARASVALRELIPERRDIKGEFIETRDIFNLK